MSDFSYAHGVGTGFSSAAAFLATRIAQVTGYSGFTAPPAPAPGNGFIQALADGVLSMIGFQAQNEQAGPGGSLNSTAFADIGFSVWTISVPVSKMYYLMVGASGYMTTLGGSQRAFFQVVVDGSAPSQPTLASRHAFNSANFHMRLFWVVPLFLAAGSHTLKLQYKVDSGGNNLVMDTNDYLHFCLIG